MLRSSSQSLSVACVIPADVDHRTPHTAVVTDAFGPDGCSLVFVDPRSGPTRFPFDLCLRVPNEAQTQQSEDEERQPLYPVASSEEVYDELCRDAVEHLVALTLSGEAGATCRSFSLVCSDWDARSASTACYGQDEDGGLLADVLAKLLPLFKRPKKKKKSADSVADPIVVIRASVVKGPDVASIATILADDTAKPIRFDAPLEVQDGASLALDEMPTSVGEALNIVSHARGDGAPGVTVVRLAIRPFAAKASTRVYCCISVVVLSALPHQVQNVAQTMKVDPESKGWSGPPRLVSLLNVKSVYRTGLQEVQQILKDASLLRSHGITATPLQARELSNLVGSVDLGASSAVRREFDELTAEIRVARLMKARRSTAEAASNPASSVGDGGPSLEQLLSDYRERRKALEIAADMFDFEASIESRTTEARRIKRSRLKAEEEVASLRAHLVEQAASGGLQPAKRDKSKSAKSSGHTFDESSGDEAHHVKALSKSDRKQIAAEDAEFTMRYEVHQVMDSFYSNWKAWSAKLEDLTRTLEGATRQREKLLKLTKPSVFKEIIRSASRAATASVETASKGKRHKHPASAEFNALLERLARDAPPTAQQAGSSGTWSLASDIVEFVVERAVMIVEGAVQPGDSYAWFDIEGASCRLRSSSTWRQPLDVTIMEYFPSVATEYPEGTRLASSDDEDEAFVRRDAPPATAISNNSPASDEAPPAPRKGDRTGTKSKEEPPRSTSTNDEGVKQVGPTTSTSQKSQPPPSSSASKKHDSEESDKRYLMAVYDSLTLVQDVTKYLKAGTVMLKHGRSGAPHDRLFWISTVGFSMELLWMDSAKKETRNSVPLPDVGSISLGPFSKVFKRHPYDHMRKEFFLSFTVTMRDGSRSVDIVAPSLPDFEAWILGLCHIARVDPFWGKPLQLAEMKGKKTPFALECMDAVAVLSPEEVQLCSTNYIFPQDYLKVKEKVEKIRDEVQLHMRLFANNAEQAFVALGGIHLPQINHKGAILMTKGELRHHCSRYNIDIFRVCEVWKHFNKIDLVYDPSFTPPTAFGVTQRK